MIDFVKQNYSAENDEPGLSFLSIVAENLRDEVKPVAETPAKAATPADKPVAETAAKAAATADKVAETPAKAAVPPEVTNLKDGTTISWTTTELGERKPSKTEFANKSTCTYSYSKTGSLQEAVVKDELGAEVCKVSLKGKEYVFERNNKVLAKADASDPSRLTLTADGGFELKPNKDEPRKRILVSQGNLEIDVQVTPTSKLSRRVEPTSSSCEVKGFETGKDGKELLTFQRFANGRVLTYGYEEKDGTATVKTVTDELENTQLLYRKVGANEWIRSGKQVGDRLPDARGTITLNDSNLPIFKPYDRTVEVSDKIQGQRIELKGAIALQQRCREMLPQIASTMFAPEKAAIENSFVKQAEKDQGCKWEDLTPETRNKLIKKLDEQTTAAFDTKHETLKRELDGEIEKLKTATSLEKVYPELTTTKACIKGLNQWVDTSVVPLVMKVNSRNGGFLDANSPIPTPKHPNSDQFVAAAYLNGRDMADFGGKIPPLFQTDKIPTVSDMQQLERKIKWCEEGLKRDREQRVKFELTVALPGLAKEYGLPTRAFNEVCANDEAKLARIKQRMDLQLEVKELAHSIFAVRETHKDLNIKLPPNCSVVKEGGVEKLVFNWSDDANINGQGNRNQDKALTEWLKSESPKFNKIMQQYADSINVANKRIMYGDLPGKGFASFDKDGRFDEVHDKDGPGRKEINLLSGGFEVEEKDGKYSIKVTWQPKRSDIENYLDIGAEKIGKPSEKVLGPFGPDEPIAVYDSHGEIRIIPAKEAAGWKQGQAAKYWGLKVATGLIDASMVVGAVATGGTALVAGRIGLRALMGAVGRGTLGATGFIGNNARVMSDPNGQEFHKVRSICMLTDVSHGLLSGGTRLLKGAKGASEVTTKGLKALEDAPLLYRIPVKSAIAATDNKAHHVTMFATNLFFLPVVGGGLKHQIEKMSKPKDKTPEVAFNQGGKKVEISDHKKVLERIAKQENQEAKLQVTENYFEIILSQDKLSDQNRKKVSELAEKVLGVVNGEMPADLKEGDESDCEKLTLAQKRARQNCNKDLLDALNHSDESVRLAATVGLLVLNKSDAEKNTDPKDTAFISLDRLIEKLERAQTSTSPNSRIVATDALVRLVRKTPFDNASVLRGVISDPKADAHAKAYSVVNLAQFVNTNPLMEDAVLKGLTPKEREDYLADSAGNSAEDMKRYLQTVAANKELPADLRTLAVRSLDIISGDDEVDVVAKKLSAEEKRCVESLKLGKGSKYTAEVLEQTEWQLQMDEITEQLRAITVRKSLIDPSNSQDVINLNNQIVKLFQDGVAEENLDASTICDAIRLLNLDSSKNLDADSRKALISFLERPTTTETKAIKQAILERAKELADSEEQRNSFKKVLPALINPQLGNTLYAQGTPELRLAAVEAIKALGLKDAEVKSVLLKVAAPETKENNLFETDAKVRLAALSTLQKIGGRDFDSAVDATIASETDVAVRAFAENAKLKVHRPIRDLMYFQKRDIAAGEIESNQDHTYANGAKLLSQLEGGLKELPLKVKVKSIVYLEQVVPDNDIERKGTRIKRTPVEREIEVTNPERKKLIDRELFGKAVSGGKDQDDAIQALIWIAMKKPHGATANQAEGDYMYDKAVNTLCDLCQRGSGARAATLTRLKSVVASPDVDPELRLKFLRAIDKSVDGDDEPQNSKLRAASITSHGKFLADVLEHDLGLTANQPGKDHRDFKARTDFRNYVLESMRKFQSPFALPVLDGVSTNKRELNGVKEKAQELLADLRDSVVHRYKESRFANGTAEEATDAAREITQSLLKANSLNQTVDAIINGSAIKPILAGDPRIEAVKQALNCKAESYASPANPAGNKENGSEMIRLAAALVVLKTRNSGFSNDDKREALIVCAQLAWDGCEFGYRRDAKYLLDQELRNGNPLVMDALAEKVLSQQGSVKDAQKYLLESMKSDRIESQLPDGRKLVIRKQAGELVVEEFKQDKLLRAATSGRPYSDVVADDMWKEKDLEKRFELAKKLLADETPEFLFATDRQRREALLLIADMAQSNDLVRASKELRFSCATYLSTVSGVNAKFAIEFKRDIMKSMVDLASSNDQAAIEYLEKLPPSMKATALEELLRRQPTVIKGPEDLEQSRLETLDRLLKTAKSEKERKDFLDLYNSRFAKTQQIDVIKMAAWAEAASRIIDSTSSNKDASLPAVDALHMAIYLEAATHLGCDHPAVRKLNIDKCLERLENSPSPLVRDVAKSVLDPRLPLAKQAPEPGTPSRKELELADRIALSVRKAKNSSDPKVLEQYAKIMDGLAPKAVASSMPGFFKDYAQLKARTGEAEAAFDKIGEIIIEDLEQFPLKLNKNTDKAKEKSDYDRLANIKSYMEQAPLSSQLKLAETLVESDLSSVRKAGYVAVTQCLESTDAKLRQKATAMLETVAKASPAHVDDAFSALLDASKTDEGIRWIIKLSDKINNPEIKAAVEKYKKTLKP